MMTKEGGRRIATSEGAVLADPELLDAVECAHPGLLFEPGFWAARGESREVGIGRGAAWFVGAGGCWVLRHYRRGGWAGRLSADRYLWTGDARIRAFAEWGILAVLRHRGLPVPRPVAARYQRAGLLYRCDLITVRIAGAMPLSALLARAPLDAAEWREVGVVIARLHAAGADHADLNAHNILLRAGTDTGAVRTGADADSSSGASAGTGDRVSIIDFDRARLRAPGAWRHANLARLRRSLAKISVPMPEDRFPAAAWQWLLAG